MKKTIMHIIVSSSLKPLLVTKNCDYSLGKNPGEHDFSFNEENRQLN